MRPRVYVTSTPRVCRVVQRRGQFTRECLDNDRSRFQFSTFRVSHRPPLFVTRSSEKPPHLSKLENWRQSGYAKYCTISLEETEKLLENPCQTNISRDTYSWKSFVFVFGASLFLSSKLFSPVFFTLTIFTSLHLFHLILQLKVATSPSKRRVNKCRG